MTERNKKVCTNCSKELSLEMFSKNKSTKDGLQTVCKECQRQYYQSNKERIKARNLKYDEGREEEKSIRFKKYYEENKEEFKERYDKNKIRILKYNQNWRKENPEKTRLYAKEYRQKINSLPHTLTEEEWINALKKFNYRCSYCGKKVTLQKDHFIPVSKDGGYTVENIIPSCGGCNSSKNNQDFFEWYPTYKFYNKNREVRILNYLRYEEYI